MSMSVIESCIEVWYNKGLLYRFNVPDNETGQIHNKVTQHMECVLNSSNKVLCYSGPAVSLPMFQLVLC